MRVWRAVAVALVHVLLTAAVVGAVVVWGFGDDPELAGQRVTVPDTDLRLPDNPERLVLVRPPGFLVMDSTTVKAGNSPDVLGDIESDVLSGAGVVAVKARVARDDGVSQGVWQMAVHDGADPRDAQRAIDALYEQGGWTRAYTAHDGVLLRTQTPSEGQPFTGYRAHYVLGPYLIRIEAYGTDKDRVDQAFATLATRQLTEWPPG
ncbi:hypothetical protein [Actinophytocola oryzae]|uniref:Lipoprotein LpqN n=1 Tax=Actinophytocola oryzae TaxID=502181 RepID=A0A4R7VMP3_9PSEU|nr:hypothetical protein [Actinophytocola oryzae]TDV50893.1 hypothetical protein CLV71_106238 [Actinophytocola oryzae]